MRNFLWNQRLFAGRNRLAGSRGQRSSGTGTPSLVQLVQTSRQKRLQLLRDDIRNLINFADTFASGRPGIRGRIYDVQAIEGEDTSTSSDTSTTPVPTLPPIMYAIEPTSLGTVVSGTVYTINGSVTGPAAGQALIRVWRGDPSTGTKLLSAGGETLIKGDLVVELPSGNNTFSFVIDLVNVAPDRSTPPSTANPWVITASQPSGDDESDSVLVPVTSSMPTISDPLPAGATTSATTYDIKGAIVASTAKTLIQAWPAAGNAKVPGVAPFATVLDPGLTQFTLTVKLASGSVNAFVASATDLTSGLESSLVLVPNITQQATSGVTPPPAPAPVPVPPAAPDPFSGSASDVGTVEGIGAARASVLRAAGIRTTMDLLKATATASGRRKLAKQTSFKPSLLLTWANNVDLFRVVGIGEEYGDLLVESGVDTIPELARRNAENLHQKIAEVNKARHLTRNLPSVAMVDNWINQAKSLAAVITH